MYVLGISSYAHEASCALLENGHIRSLAEEERWTREKHADVLAIGDYLVTKEPRV